MTELLVEKDSNGVAWVTLNRPEKYNAFNDQIIASLIEVLNGLEQDDSIIALVLKAEGKHFSAGADLKWMRSMAEKTEAENLQDARQLALLLSTLDNFSRPTIALVQGAAFGGALGLVCCCDIAIGTPDSHFCLSEVKLGLIPATISPYVIRTMGQRQSRHYFVTAELIDARTAQQLGILHTLSDNADQSVQSLLQQIQNNSPQAVKAAKQLCLTCHNQPIDESIIEYTSQAIAEIRVSAEGQEGLNAFFDKRPASWRKHD